MFNETDAIPGLEDLASAARERAPMPAASSAHTKRSKVPSLRVLTAGGIVLRGVGALVVFSGLLPVALAAIEAYLLFGGTIVSDYHFTVTDGEFSFRARGWFAIIPFLILAGLVWCLAIVPIAMGHGLYVLRDLAKSMNDRRPPTG